MIEQEFKQNFLASFMATWCANHYTEYCMAGKHKELANPAMEDAVELANDVWNNMKKEGIV